MAIRLPFKPENPSGPAATTWCNTLTATPPRSDASTQSTSLTLSVPSPDCCDKYQGRCRFLPLVHSS